MDASQENIQLLLVEDSEDDAELIRRELAGAGMRCRMERVYTRDALLDRLAAQRWDIILSDFAMPGFNGLEAFQVVEALDLDVPFIFVSGAMGEERAVAAMRAGARDYILKGNLKRLAGAVRRELDSLRSRRERQVAEAEARKEARRLAMAVEASGAGIFEYDVPAGIEAYFSERWAEILGFPRSELRPLEGIPDWFFARLHPDDRNETLASYRRFIEGEVPRFVIETRVEHQDGHWVSVALFIKAVKRNDSAAVTQLVGVMLDLTERRRLEGELRQAQKMEAIGRLAGGVAHDFNNLLTVMFAFGDFVLEELEEGGAARADMEQVMEAARRAADLTRQLLTFSRRQEMSPQVLNLNELITGLGRMLVRVIGEDVVLELELAEDLQNVRIDPGAFEQVVVNLAVNARDAMPDGGHLRIATANLDLHHTMEAAGGERIPVGSYVCIEVRDQGVGMDALTRERIFEPFFTTKEVGKGTGLGLSTCFGIVQQAHGFLRVESARGTGTTFKVYLPQEQAAVDPAAGEREPVPLQGNETILVVEDDTQVRELVTRTLSELGYSVMDARDVEEALRVKAARGLALDLLVTDVVLQGTDGTVLAAALRGEQPGLPVLYMSGYAQDPILRRAAVEASTDILLKPFHAQDLARAVRRALDRKEGSV
ncbi:MAG: response regulator [Gammaproteobacteria bacterium]|nr:response regulator [Gammaproteobacteria bacterium]